MSAAAAAELWTSLFIEGLSGLRFGGPSASIASSALTHKPVRVHAAIEAAGAPLRDLPPYRPAVHPIEMAFAKLKALLRKAAARAIPGFVQAIRQAIAKVAPTECANHFDHAEYEPV